MRDVKGIAVVTGASSGIGAVYADRLAERGYDLVLVARSADKLAEVADRVREKTGRNVDVLPADLADAGDLARVEAFLKATPGITMLVNNAGLGGTAKLVDADVDQMTSMIALNVTALTRLTYAIVPQFAARGAGMIINIASIVAINPEALNGVYGGSKAFVVGFSQNLRHELAGTRSPGAGRSSRRDRYGLLGNRRPTGRASAARDRDAQRGSGRRSAGRARPGRIRHHSIPARWRVVRCL